MSLSKTGVDIVLVHYPVINKIGETIGSAVTNLDLHDIARAAKTFGVDNYYIVTPYTDQQGLVAEILEHWNSGHGSVYNPARKEALELVKVADSLETVITRITDRQGKKPLLLTTSAQRQNKSLSYQEVRGRIKEGEAMLLLFGTAHGMAPQVMDMADYTLPPVGGNTGYNHLSVRSAVSIILDRLLGNREEN
ncbi:MAG: RNA methyltransferase [Proteobacteria bacterium]|nr:RNA methyltransferase [Pseudomonadota bacterium]MBU1058046.1 RNA methyltransferase [Pseudomonadota bacterium]